MQFKPGDIVQFQDQLFIVVEQSGNLVYTLDFETQQRQGCFIGVEELILIPKPENVEWLFIKRRELNARFIMKYRGF